MEIFQTNQPQAEKKQTLTRRAATKNNLIQLAIAGVIAAVYFVVTAFIPTGAGGFFRPAEALTLLPLLFAGSIPGLFVGCFFANLFFSLGAIDALLGGIASLIAAVLTYLVSKLPVKNKFNYYKLFLGAIPPIVVNMLLIPVVIILSEGDTFVAYWGLAGAIGLTQVLMTVLLGIPLTLAMYKNRYLMQFSYLQQASTKVEATQQ